MKALRQKHDYPAKEKILDKPPPTTTRTYRSKITRDSDTPPPDSDPAAVVSTATGRGSRRARAVVNYAEPKLGTKLRREVKGFVDAVPGEGKLRQISAEHTAPSTPAINPEGADADAEDLKRHEIPAFHEPEPIKKHRTSTSITDDDDAKPSVLTTRKRRTSALVTPPLPAEGETERGRQSSQPRSRSRSRSRSVSPDESEAVARRRRIDAARARRASAGGEERTHARAKRQSAMV